MNDSKNIRVKILSFLSNNIVSLPIQELKISSDMPKYFQILYCFDLELLEIKKSFKQNREQTIKNKYLAQICWSYLD